jgi:succinate dehydrogenase / fumarate reductase flavoprotein subunit
MHGANRLGGNSLSDLIVFGGLAGDGAQKYLQGQSGRPAVPEDAVRTAFRRATDILNRESGPNPYVLHERLQETMGNYVGIVRTGEELEKGIAAIGELAREAETVKAQGSSQYNPGWDEALALRSLLIASEAVARAAHTREESRGAHTRLDFEGEREEWLAYNVVIRKAKDGSMEVEKVKRPEPPAALAEIAYADIEDLEAGKVGAGA